MQEFREQYLAGRERMHPELERLVKDNQTTISNNNAFPQIDAQGNRINFEELSSYKRFIDIVAKVKHYTGVQDLSNPSALMQLQGMLMRTFQEIIPVQRQYKSQLERLSIELVVREEEIPNGAFQFDSKLVGMGEISKEKFQQDSKEPSQDEIEEQFGGDNFEGEEFETPNDSFDKEKQKRRFTNALIQGSAKKGHYMFELVRNELNQMHPNLSNMYGIVMSINDLMYWMMPDEQMKRMAGDSVNGEEEIDTETEPPTIKAKGILFPILVHELIKGVYDVFGTHGFPDDPKSQQMIMDSTDTLTNEMWDLRLGGFFWERLNNMFPISIFEEGNKHIKHYLFARLVALETNEFNKVFQDIMMNNSDGKKFVEDMIYDIKKDMNERALNESLSQYDFESNEDEEEGYGLFKKGGGVGKYNTYKLRAEGLNDFMNFLGTGVYSNVKSYTVEPIGFPDVVVSFETNLSLSEIKAKLREVQDSHVMLDTIKPIKEYTGERYEGGGGVEKLNLTELETKILRYFLSKLDVYQLGYSDTSVDDIANGINVNINSVKGSVGSLAKKGIIYVSDLGEGIGTIVYIQDDYEYLHPEYKDYISKMADGGGVGMEKSYNNPENAIHVLHIDNQNWYLEKIDSTHFYMSNDPNFRGMANHIGQHKGELYYDEVKQWLKDTQFDNGGGVGWNENALEELQEFEGDDEIQITTHSGNLFYASNDNAEYIVFKSYDDAYDYAYQMVNQDLVDNPEYFNQNWLSNFVDIDGAKYYLTEVYDEWNYSYANDIKMESDSKYSNRLISEMVDAGLMDDEDAESEDAESTAISLMDDFVEYLTNSQIDEGRGGLDYYENNFGQEQTMQMIIENNLIDIDEATEGAISEDGVAHFISSYDGNEIELPSGYYAYRTN
jgi:predicted transcriptional regulator